MARGRSLREFQTSFPDETSCAAFLFERRWPQGFVCPACGAGRAAFLRSRAHTYECLDCGRQTSITAGTVMHRSKLPLTVWFWAAHLMATHSNGMSAVQLEALLGQGILEQFLAASFQCHYDMMRLEKGIKRQAVLDQRVAGARETGEAVSEKRLLHSCRPR